MPFNGLHARLRPRRLLGARAKDKDYPMADATNDTASDASGRDYRDTVFLPETPFPMRGGLPKKEPEIIAAYNRRATGEKYLIVPTKDA